MFLSLVNYFVEVFRLNYGGHYVKKQLSIFNSKKKHL